MIFQLGGLTLDCPGGLNPQDIKEHFGADYAVKAIVGAQPRREAVGVADRAVTITGTIYPFAQERAGVSPGLRELDALKAMVYSQDPQILINAAGQNLGWFYILSVDRDDSNLSALGIGRVINFTITMAESPVAAQASSMIRSLLSLFT